MAEGKKGLRLFAQHGDQGPYSSCNFWLHQAGGRVSQTKGAVPSIALQGAHQSLMTITLEVDRQRTARD
jgi:hypothetical protein